jgi:hypothetical protein
LNIRSPSGRTRASSARWPSGSTELEALPTTCRQVNWRTALSQGRCPAFNFDQPLRFAPRTPCDQIRASTGLSESCPKNADVPKSPFPCNGSPGAVGRHNNTPNRVAFGCRCRKHPHPVRVGTLRRGCHPFRNRRAPNWTPVWQSIKRYSTGAQFADCTKRPISDSPDA